MNGYSCVLTSFTKADGGLDLPRGLWFVREIFLSHSTDDVTLHLFINLEHPIFAYRMALPRCPALPSCSEVTDQCLLLRFSALLCFPLCMLLLMWFPPGFMYHLILEIIHNIFWVGPSLLIVLLSARICLGALTWAHAACGKAHGHFPFQSQCCRPQAERESTDLGLCLHWSRGWGAWGFAGPLFPDEFKTYE